MGNKQIIHFGDLDYIVNEEEDKYVLKSNTKDEYGYYSTIKFPKNGDTNSFQKKIEDFLLREIL